MILWVLGLVSSYTMGGFIHILLVLAVYCADTGPLSEALTTGQMIYHIIAFI